MSSAITVKTKTKAQKTKAPETLTEAYAKIVRELYRHSGGGLPSFPRKDEYPRNKDGDTFFSLFRLLYDNNREPMRKAIVHTLNAKIEHEICSWSKKIVDNEKGYGSTISRYEEKRIQTLYFTIYFANALEDTELMDRVYSSLQTKRTHNKFFVIRNYYCPANLIFGLAPAPIKKSILDRIFRDTKRAFPKNYEKVTGDFISGLLRIVTSAHDRSLFYVKWFVENYSVEEREAFLKMAISSWSIRKDDGLRSCSDMSETIEQMTLFHPSIRNYFESLTMKSISNSSLEDIDKSRVISNLKKYEADDLKKAIASKLYLKCKDANIDFFKYIEKHQAALGESNIERLSNFT